VYIVSFGGDGFCEVFEIVVLNVNYLLVRLCEGCVGKYLLLVFECCCMYEFVFLGVLVRCDFDIKMFDVVKWLFDYGFYLLMIYFLLFVDEVLMVELIEIEICELFDVFVEVFDWIFVEVECDL